MTITQMKLAGAIVAVGLVGSMLAAPREAVAAPPELVVVDGTGTVIGPVVPGPAESPLLWVAHTIEGVPVKLLLGENGPWDTKTRQPLLYESSDCSGTATIDVPKEPDAVRDAVIFGTEVFWPAGEGSDRSIRSAAWLVRNAEDCTAALVGPTLCCTALPKAQVIRTAPATGIALASLRLNVPFRVEQAR
jgi:hypothetical protein